MTAVPVPVPLDRLTDRLGLDPATLPDVDRTRAEAALADATTLALAEVAPSVAERWESNGLPGVVALVVVQAAQRQYTNPEGYSSQGLGEFTATASTVGVYFTPAERVIVRRAATGRSGFTGSVRIRSAYDAPAPGASRDWLTYR